MFAQEFIFNGQSSKEYGVMICSFNGETSVSVGEIEVTTILAPNKNEHDYYDTIMSGVLSWNFSIIKNNCFDQNDSYFSADEERHIVKWLMGERGYKELLFIQDGYENIYYKAYFQITPHQIGGRTVGYDLTATANASYGYTMEYNRVDYFQDENENFKPIQIQINNDIRTKLYPYITIENMSGDTIEIINSDIHGNEICKSIFYNMNMSKNDLILMDSYNDIIQGLDNASSFNYGFLYLVDGMNVLTCNANTNVKFTISYREIRKVVV